MMFHLSLVVLLCSLVESTDIKATFPFPNEAMFPRIRLGSPLPNLRELTLCSWIKVDQLNGSRLAPVVSYSTVRNNNEFLVLFFNQNGVLTPRVYRGAQEANINCDYNCNIGSWCHLCVSWFGANGRVNTYVKGNKCKVETLNYHEPYVPMGGVLVIGQEQDGLDSAFDANQSWIGDISNFQMWDEVLSEEQVLEASSCERKRKGNVISWLETPMVALDGVVLSATQLCSP